MRELLPAMALCRLPITWPAVRTTAPVALLETITVVPLVIASRLPPFKESCPLMVRLLVTNLTAGILVLLIVKLKTGIGLFTKKVFPMGVRALPIWNVPPVIVLVPAPLRIFISSGDAFEFEF